MKVEEMERKKTPTNKAVKLTPISQDKKKSLGKVDLVGKAKGRPIGTHAALNSKEIKNRLADSSSGEE